MQTQQVEIINKLGLHARAASKLTQLANHYRSDIWLSCKGRRINAKSIMGVMMLAASQGCHVEIQAEGEDESQAVVAIAALIANRFHETA